jgi:hypothetical protein
VLGWVDLHAGFDLRLMLVNDFGTFTPHHDDLYTGALAVSGKTERMECALAEYLFTDESNEIRFDETWITASRTVVTGGRWTVRAQGGAVHVGEGILGDSFQNRVHDLLGSDEISLPYIEDSDWHGTLGFAVERSVPLSERLAAEARLEGWQAFGFKGDTLAAATVEWKLKPRLVLCGQAGARYTGTDLAELKPWIDGFAPAAAVGVRYKHLLDASYNFNDLGTEDHHWRFLLTWRVGRHRGGADAKSLP